ncbi:MAG: hypothetical protein V1807_01620 [Patescibacteria group bacterium]
MSRRAFVFSLYQNFDPQLVAGQLVYETEPTDLPERLRPVFFIGRGQYKGHARLITGPYELTSDKIIYNPTTQPQVATRMGEIDPVHGVWQELSMHCPYRVFFRPLVPIKYGAVWNSKFCQELHVDFEAWDKLINVVLDEEQIQALADYLTEINIESVA